MLLTMIGKGSIHRKRGEVVERIIHNKEYKEEVNMSIYGHYFTEESELKNGSHIQKGYKNLKDFRRESISEQLVQKYKDKFTFLKHLRTGDNINGFIYFDDNDNIVAIIAVETKYDDEKWIQALEVSKDYQEYGLSRQLLKVATKELGAKYLSVNKSNKLAIKIYENFGFITYEESGVMYFMKFGG